jgi:hypothetical protein
MNTLEAFFMVSGVLAWMWLVALCAWIVWTSEAEEE